MSAHGGTAASLPHTLTLVGNWSHSKCCKEQRGVTVPQAGARQQAMWPSHFQPPRVLFAAGLLPTSEPPGPADLAPGDGSLARRPRMQGEPFEGPSLDRGVLSDINHRLLGFELWDGRRMHGQPVPPPRPLSVLAHR